jgi:hypothetical protein
VEHTEAEVAAVAVLMTVLILLHPLCLSNKTSIAKKQDGTSTHSSTSSNRIDSTAS